jgi:hypothetical protein
MKWDRYQLQSVFYCVYDPIEIELYGKFVSLQHLHSMLLTFA